MVSIALALASAGAGAQQPAHQGLPHYTTADVQFMQGMISHHAQAITMARWAPSHGASGNVQVLCGRIVVSQRDEIHSMQRWLSDRHEVVPDSLGNMPMGMHMRMGEPQASPGKPTSRAAPADTLGGREAGRGVASTSRGAASDSLGHMNMQMSMGPMPGMLTPDQMAQLDHANGPDFDRLFLVFMIQHHEGALTMVKQLMESEGAAQDETVFKFASDVNADQTAEIDRMAHMLGAP